MAEQEEEVRGEPQQCPHLLRGPAELPARLRPPLARGTMSAGLDESSVRVAVR